MTLRSISILTITLALSLVACVTCAGASSHRGFTSNHSLVPSRVFLMATRVAVCEEGGWGRSSDAHGKKYYGNLGWLDATWQMYKLPGFPSRADHATPEQQARAMLHFVHVAFHDQWPDQGPPGHRCTGGY